MKLDEIGDKFLTLVVGNNKHRKLVFGDLHSYSNLLPHPRRGHFHRLQTVEATDSHIRS